MIGSVQRRTWASTRAVTTAMLLACAVARCGMERTLRDVMMLQQGLMREYQEPAIGVNVANGVLTVVFQNSKRASLPERERSALAHQVAEFVRDHYAEYGHLSRVQIGFTTAHQYGPLTTTRSDVPYSYAATDLGPAPAAATSATPATHAAPN